MELESLVGEIEETKALCARLERHVNMFLQIENPDFDENDPNQELKVSEKVDDTHSAIALLEFYVNFIVLKRTPDVARKILERNKAG